MNAPTRINSALNVRDQFPAIVNWHYLDSAATAQKPQAVIDAITEAYTRDYATVHRGVYQRSSDMTAAYEASRAAASKLIDGQANELIFTRGATEAINLVARALPKAVPRLPVDVAAIGADFYAFSAHKLYGPTGIGCLWGRADLLLSLPPSQGGGAMIEKLTFEETTYLDPPARFEAGTPHIVGSVGLHAAVNWVEKLSLDAVHAHECALVAETRAALSSVPGVTIYGPEDSAGIVSFNVDGVHPHDTATILDDAGVAVRAGHHCAQPLMRWLCVEATARASFAAHSDSSDIEALVKGIEQVKRIFG